MGSDQLIQVVSSICTKLLPVVGLIVLIFLIIFLKKGIDTLKAFDVTLNKTNDLVDEIKGQARKLDKPLDTINDLSLTVDEVHDATKKAVSSAINTVATNLEQVRNFVSSKLNKKEDIIITDVNEEK